MNANPSTPASPGNAADLKARLAELAAQYESIQGEMDTIQSKLESLGEPAPADAGAPLGNVEVETLRAQVAEWQGKYQRALADYANSQRRALENEREAKYQGVRGVVQSLAPALDHFGMALNIDPDKTTVESLKNGVGVIRDEIMKILGTHGLSVIDPKPGDEFDPTKHEAMLQAKAEGMAPNHVVQVFQTGFLLNDRTLRPAKVSVST